MNNETIQATFGGLLHDIGKLVYRSGAVEGTHSQAGYIWLKNNWAETNNEEILNCVRYHHSADIRTNPPPDDSLAYIVWFADNIAAAADRRKVAEEGTFDRYLALAPIFSHLNGNHPGKALVPAPLDGKLRVPVSDDKIVLTSGTYSEILSQIKIGINAVSTGNAWVDSLLSLLETLTSTLPSSTNAGESPDISLYDHLKITAAVSAAIAEFCSAHGITNYKDALWTHEKDFLSEETMLLYSADFSGIQNFIYTVANKNALRSLRSRSFILEMMMENYIDELLKICGVSRANLLYSGGGHCYILLPNTEQVIDQINLWNTRMNNFLIDEFGTSLFLAHGYTPCSANDLTNTPADVQPYKAMFRRVSEAIANHKLHRYSIEQIRYMNSKSSNGAGRECSVCGRSDHLYDIGDNQHLCKWCKTFVDLSRKIREEDIFLVSDLFTNSADFSLPASDRTLNFTLTDETHARKALADNDSVVRVYSKNRSCTGMKYSTKVYIGDYASANLLEDLADQSEGIKRLGVCRMDVDNLGAAFVSGFEDSSAKTPQDKGKFVTISRTAAFSRQMSYFFKYLINPILNGDCLGRKSLDVAVVYSGGDDVFMVGAWDSVIEAASRIRETLTQYTCSSLTISAGILMVDDHMPIRLTASLAGGLEEEAKSLPGKNALSLFAIGDGQAYTWDRYSKKIIGQKLSVINAFFDSSDTQQGNAFLYNILSLLTQAQGEGGKSIHIARLAYQLSRARAGKGYEAEKAYKAFTDNVYTWALNAEDRQELITAIYLRIYSTRKGIINHE